MRKLILRLWNFVQDAVKFQLLWKVTSVQWFECLLKTSTYKFLVAGIMEVEPKISCSKAEIGLAPLNYWPEGLHIYQFVTVLF